MESTDLPQSKVKWYSCLVPKDRNSPGKRSIDLMSNYSEQDLYKGLLICAITRSGNHIFSLFPSHVAYAKFQQSLPESKRCCFEVILGHHNQKPHFDLEVEIEELEPEELALFGEELFQEFLKVLIPTFKETYGPSLNLAQDIVIFTSHGAKKRSFHVIIDNYSHRNNKEAKAFYQAVLDRLPIPLRRFVDGSVYSKKQQFRVVGCQKQGSGRVKTLLRRWVWQGHEIVYNFKEEPVNGGHELVLLLEASLVSNTRSCKALPCLLPEETNKASSAEWQEEQGDLASETVKVAFKMLGERAKTSISDPRFPYEVRDVMGHLILLKRRYPSNCQICQRIHEHENPYMLVLTDESTKMRHVYFDCRRAEGRRLYLGILPEVHQGKYLPDTPILEDVKKALSTRDILSRVKEISYQNMKEVRAAPKAGLSRAN